MTSPIPPEVLAAQRVLARARRMERLVSIATTAVELGSLGVTVAGAWLRALWLGLMVTGIAGMALSYLWHRRRT